MSKSVVYGIFVVNKVGEILDVFSMFLIILKMLFVFFLGS